MTSIITQSEMQETVGETYANAYCNSKLIAQENILSNNYKTELLTQENALNSYYNKLLKQEKIQDECKGNSTQHSDLLNKCKTKFIDQEIIANNCLVNTTLLQNATKQQYDKLNNNLITQESIIKNLQDDITTQEHLVKNLNFNLIAQENTNNKCNYNLLTTELKTNKCNTNLLNLETTYKNLDNVYKKCSSKLTNEEIINKQINDDINKCKNEAIVTAKNNKEVMRQLNNDIFVLNDNIASLSDKTIAIINDSNKLLSLQSEIDANEQKDAINSNTYKIIIYCIITMLILISLLYLILSR